MWTDSLMLPTSAVARIRAELVRAQRGFAAQAPALRWSLGLAAAAVFATLIYGATNTSTPASGLVRSGALFASDELIGIARALDAKHVPYRIDSQNRVEVAADRLDEANEIVAKLDVGPRSIDDIVQKALETSPWESSSVTEQRLAQARNTVLEQLIRPLPGIVSATVFVSFPKSRVGRRNTPEPTAFVSLETKDDRTISAQTVASIQNLIAGKEHEIKPDAVSIFDRSGRQYLNARNPSLAVQARTRARQDELRDEILEELHWLKGADVSVKLTPATVIPMPQPPAAALPPLPSTANASAVKEEVRLPPLSVGVNQPLELASDEPAPSRAAMATATPAPPTPPSAHSPAPAEDRSVANAKARVWVKVPNSYYLKALPIRQPSLDDVQPLVERTRVKIERAVKLVVPPGQLEELVVDSIPDTEPARSSEPAPGSTDARRALPWWLPAGVAGGATSALLLVGFRLFAARRPSLRLATRGRDNHTRYQIDDAVNPGPGPAERVRELIRLNPEAAASVLHRWTGQGGPIG